MVLTWLGRLLAAPVFEHDEDRTRAAGLLSIALWGVLASVVVFITVGPGSWMAGIVMVALLLGMRLLMRLGYVRVVSIALPCGLWVGATYLALATDGLDSFAFTGLVLAVAAAGLLLGRAAVIAAGALCVATLAGSYYAGISGLIKASLQQTSPLSNIVAQAVAVGMVAICLYAARRDCAEALERARQSELVQRESDRELEQTRSYLERRVEERTRELQVAAEVSSAALLISDIDVLLPQVVELVRARFGLYYVGLFLLDDENRFAVLRAGSGEPGRQMPARGWRLPVGGSSMIGRCIATGVADAQMDVRQASVHLDNPLLPDTRSELALPLRVRGQAIGALSVQSVETSAFDQVTVSALQTLANQVAIAIANAQLYAEAQAALAETRAVQDRYQARTWRQYLQATPIDQYETAPPGAVPLGDTVLPEIREAAAKRRATVLHGDHAGGASQSALVAPIMLRGEVIGVLGIHDDLEARPWTDEDISLVEEVIERLALTIESLSLLDRTLRSEARERTITEVSSRIRGSLDLETVLKTAVDEVQRALGLEKVAVRLTAAQVGEDPV